MWIIPPHCCRDSILSRGSQVPAAPMRSHSCSIGLRQDDWPDCRLESWWKDVACMNGDLPCLCGLYVSSSEFPRTESPISSFNIVHFLSARWSRAITVLIDVVAFVWYSSALEILFTSCHHLHDLRPALAAIKPLAPPGHPRCALHSAGIPSFATMIDIQQFTFQFPQWPFPPFVARLLLVKSILSQQIMAPILVRLPRTPTD